MKFKIQREDLVTALQQVIGVVEKRQTLPALSNVLIKATDNSLIFITTDLEIELLSRLELSIDESGEITLPAKKLLDIAKSLANECEITITIDDNRAIIKSGRSRFTLSTLPASDFPSLDDISRVYEFNLPQRVLKELIDKTAFAMAQQDVRYYLNGLMMEISSGIIRTVATDGHRLAYCEKPLDGDLTDSKQVIIPRKGVSELSRLLTNSDDTVKIILGSNHIQCELLNQRFTSKLIEGRFPDYKRVMPDTEGNIITVNKELLKQALIRASILTNEKYRGIRVIMNNNLLTLQAQNPDQEQANIEVEVDYTGDPIEIGFNVNYMLDILNTSTTEMIRGVIKDSNSSCLLSFPDEPHAKYVIMPMRL